MSAKKLTPKQQKFVGEYLVDLNATQAAIRAGYSAKTAKVVGCQNLTKPNIAAAVQAAKLKLSERNKCDQDQAFTMYKEAFDLAREVVNPSAMTGAVTGIAKLLGLNEAEKQQIDHGVSEEVTGFTIKIKK